MIFCVLVASADNRRDIFNICFANSERIWAGCQWPRYVGLTTPQPDVYGFRVVTSPQMDWAAAVTDYINALPADHRYILLMVEDVLFMRPVNNAMLNEISLAVANCNLDYVRLVPLRRSWFRRLTELLKPELSNFLRYIRPTEPYFSSTEMVIWKREYLLEQLSHGDDAWSFEHRVTSRDHWAVGFPVFDQHQIVQKGRWNWDAPRLLAKFLGYPQLAPEITRILRRTRPFQTLAARLRGHRENISFALFGFTSFRVRRWLGQMFSILGIRGPLRHS